MHYQNKINKPTTILIMFIMFIISVNVVIGQLKDKNGYLFGNVVFTADRQDDYGSSAPRIFIELQDKNKIIKIMTNEAGLISEKLPKGKYCIQSVKTFENKIIDLKSGQNKCFLIKSGLTKRFDIELLKPKN